MHFKEFPFSREIRFRFHNLSLSFRDFGFEEFLRDLFGAKSSGNLAAYRIYNFFYVGSNLLNFQRRLLRVLNRNLRSVYAT